MRPIELTVQGLHSFRDKQTIPFDQLCEGGVFGIFGPTGSGKSSLLDAMTLALFGKVERANNNTQGIMNHAEDTLSVSFTFELGGKDRYKVDRSYKRTGEISMQIRTCRLIELSNDETVLADKERDVTKNVEQLLGLTNEDFTRAVVLPQGKFAEFLSLKGIDRRKMLQRLFHLEKYGDRLNEKLKARTDAAQARYNEIAAEQQGLGDASKEAVKAARGEWEQAEARVAEAERSVREAEKRHEEAKQLWEWQRGREATKRAMAELEARGEETARLERRLREAREADKLAPYLAEAERAAERLNACEARVGEAERALAEAKARFARAEEAHARAKTARAEHEPRLFGRKEQLKQALRQEEEIGGVEKELAREREKASEAESVWQKQTKAIEAEERELARWLEAQKDLKRELEAIRMPYEEKTRIRKAAEAARAIASQREAVKEAEKERDEKRQAVETLQKEAEKLAQEHEKRLEQFRQAYEYVLERYNEVCEIDKLRELAMAVLRKQEAEALEAWDQQRERQLAGELAQHLHDGEPCPVCGATEHPALAAESEMEMDRSELERIRKQIETGRSMDVGSLKVRIEQIAGRIAEWLDDKQYETLTAATAEVAQNEEYLEISELNKQLQRLKETFGHWEKSRSTELRNMTALKESVTQKQSMLDSKKQEWQTADKKMQDLQSRMKTQESHWQETYSEWSLETIAEKEQQMSENEKRESSLQQRIEKSVPQIEAKSQTIEKVKTDRHQTELEKTKADHRVAELERTLKTSRAQLKEIVGDKTASELLKDVEKTLRQLAEDERTHEEQRKSAENGYVEAQKQASSAKDALIDAKKQAHDTEQQWMKYLSESAFATSEDVKEAKAEAAVQTEWERSIEQFYDEKKRLEHEARQYEEKLAGREMDEAQWQAAREAFEKAKAEQGEAREARGNAKQKLDDLQAKHETFARLDAERKETEAMLEKLNQLRTVFRGNGFVEFVAEEQLMNVSREASERLGALTRQRYGIEVDSSGGFIMRDDANGGVRRPVTTLSGGETFLTSLALALSLSAQIQLRGRYPLEFFFLDEGFGTLDQELLDTVVTALEKLRFERFSVGVISHVPELKSRLPVQLLVEPPEPSGEGSRTHLKIL